MTNPLSDLTPVYFDVLRGRPGKGPIPSKHMLVGIAPSMKRPAHRRLEPFGARSWKLIERIRAGCPDLYITNLIKIPQPSGKKIGVRLIREWLPLLEREIEVVQPERILTFGAVPAKALCEGFKSLREDRGTFFKHHLGPYVVPTYHPAAMYKDPSLGKFFGRDLFRYMELPDPVPAPYHFIQTWPDFPDRAIIILDIETISLEDLTIIQIGIKIAGQGETLIMENPDEASLVDLGIRLKRSHCSLCCHNGPFDLRVLLKQTKMKFPRLMVEDTMLLAHLAGERPLNLKSLTTFHTGLPGSHSGGGFMDPLYLAEDVRSTEALLSTFAPWRETYIYGVLRDLVPVVTAMRIRGVYLNEDDIRVMLRDTDKEAKVLYLKMIDLSVQKRVRETLERGERLAGLITDGFIPDEDMPEALGEVDKLREEAEAWELGRRSLSINFNSAKQVGDWLIEQGVPLTAKTPTGQFATGEDAIEPLKDKYPPVSLLLQHRSKAKAVSGFYGPYLEWLQKSDGLLHPRLLLTGTRTGRLAMRDPNLQQVPRAGPTKLAFVSRWPGGSIGLIDFSQAELRVAALICQDEAFAEALLARDVHLYIASLIYEIPVEEITPAQRKASKAVTFGLMYGGSIAGLAYRSGLPEHVVAEVVKRFFSQFPVLQAWLKGQRAVAASGEVTTIFGRKRDLSLELAKEGLKSAYRKAANTPIQSVASDVALVVLRETDRLLRKKKLKSRCIFGVHDSVLLEIYPDEEEAVAAIVQQAFRSLWETPLGIIPLFQRLPLVGDFIIGPSWAHVESTNENYSPTKIWECSSAKLDLEETA